MFQNLLKNSCRIVKGLAVFVLLSLFNPVYSGLGDSLINGIRVEAKLHYGIVLPHHKAIQYVLRDNIKGAEITLSTESKGRHYWESLYRFPRYGIGYYYNDFSNPDILGKSHSAFGFIDVPFYRERGKLSLSYQVAFGIGLFTKTYETYENPLNMAISKVSNAFIGFDIIARYKVGNHHELKSALELSHYSNGKKRSPNMGINTITFTTAWLYSLKPVKYKNKQTNKVNYKKHFYELIYNAGTKRDDMLNERLYFISTIIFDYNYAFTPKYAVGAGVDLFYDQSLSHIKAFEEKEPLASHDNYQAGAHFGLRARFGRLNIVLNAGRYVYANYYKYTAIYSRLGMRYALTEKLLFNLTIKAHHAIADYLEWGLGYRFKTGGI